jgi:RNA polymerase sigma-70 factor (ECF subfamily)
MMSGSPRELTTESPHDSSSERTQELALLTALLSGSREAARLFVERYTPVIEARVRRILFGARTLSSEEDVQDLVSDIWVALLNEDMALLRRFNPNRQIKVSTWIGLLARNKTIDRLRSKRRGTVSMEELGPSTELRSKLPLPPDVVEGLERKKLASLAFEQLSPEERRFMEAWYVDDETPAHIAEDFGIAVGTVYTRRFKIQAKLIRSIRAFSSARPEPHRAPLARAA